MKALTKNSLLALLCLFGSNTFSQVATPPAIMGLDTAPAPVLVYGEISSRTPSDTVILTFWNHYLNRFTKMPAPLKIGANPKWGTVYAGTARKQTFTIKVPAFSDYGYFSLGDGDQTFLDRYLVRAGDSIKVSIDSRNRILVFAGPSADFYQCQRDLELARAHSSFNQKVPLHVPDRKAVLEDEGKRRAFSESNNGLGRGVSIIENGRDQLQDLISQYESLSAPDRQSEVLRRYRDKVDPFALQILEANSIGTRRAVWLRGVHKYLWAAVRKLDDKALEEEVRQLYDDWIRDLPEEEFSLAVMTNALGYMDYLFEKNRARMKFMGMDFITAIGERYAPGIRDILLTKYLTSDFQRLDPSDRQRFLAEAIHHTTTPWVMELFNKYVGINTEKSTLPDFSLLDTNGGEVPLDKLKGKVSLIDFWYTGCKACIGFYKNTLRPLEDHFSDKQDFQIVSISADPSTQRWLKSISSGNYTNPKGTNLTTKGFDHPLLKYFNIYGFPYQVLLDQKGRVIQTGGLQKSANELIPLLEDILKQNTDH
ncbi:TlpA family protein disulfide reductase [Echinicola marina]|uniref:TlpA family protein disulfide reductase n=1 Tax=Echinicola marina TaxID=2859768 RepID=UPI001CF658BB|nr:TlpA disulfide reductase family protein [Echinicola marina]UCS95040.1 TlpA family protein disulfide reductase [Echinicola marina]